MKVFKLKIFVSVFLLLFACKTNKKNVIDKEGIYSLNHELVLHIFNENNLISFQIKDKNNRILYKFKNKFSNYHRWYFLYSHNSLWLYSGDIGVYGWSLQNKKHVMEYNIDEINKQKNVIPIPIYKELKKMNFK